MHSALLKDLIITVSVATPDTDCATTLRLKDGQNSMTKQAYRDNSYNILLGFHLHNDTFLFFFSACITVRSCGAVSVKLRNQEHVHTDSDTFGRTSFNTQLL